MKLELHYVPDSGFVARGPSGPRIDAPQDWIVWHFTHLQNLQSIADDDSLISSSSKTPVVNVANTGIKDRRAWVGVNPDDSYPESTVAEHVPFYIAAKSPMLYAVTRGHDEYRGGNDDIIFLGLCLGDIAESGATWCASNANAAAAITEFSREISSLGHFVDFPVLMQRDWYNTADDTNRKSRRAAEVLVLGSVPLESVSVVAAKRKKTLDAARQILGTVGGVRQYHELPQIYY